MAKLYDEDEENLFGEEMKVFDVENESEHEAEPKEQKKRSAKAEEKDSKAGKKG